MSAAARDTYLATEVRTAGPQKVQLLLIEAALRAAHRGRQKWQTAEDDQAIEAIIRAQEIVSELLAGLNHDAGSELVRRVSGVYNFIFRSLVEAGRRRDETKLAEAIHILEIERETWRKVCENAAPGQPSGHGSGPPPPKFAGLTGADLLDSSAGLSLEA